MTPMREMDPTLNAAIKEKKTDEDSESAILLSSKTTYM